MFYFPPCYTELIRLTWSSRHRIDAPWSLWINTQKLWLVRLSPQVKRCCYDFRCETSCPVLSSARRRPHSHTFGHVLSDDHGIIFYGEILSSTFLCDASSRVGPIQPQDSMHPAREIIAKRHLEASIHRTSIAHAIRGARKKCKNMRRAHDF